MRSERPTSRVASGSPSATGSSTRSTGRASTCPRSATWASSWPTTTGFWSEVKREATHDIRQAEPGLPAIMAIHHHPRYRLALRICADDDADVVRVEARLDDMLDPADPGRVAHPLRLYALLAPRLGSSGRSNRAWVGSDKGRTMLFAQNGPVALALACEPRPTRQSVGYVGVSDGWQDFASNGRMTWTYADTEPGNVACMAELVLADGSAQVVLAFGMRPEEAALQACAALAIHFEEAWAAIRRALAGVPAVPESLPRVAVRCGPHAVPDVGRGAPGARRSDTARCDGRQPLDPVGRYPRRSGRLPPGLVARPGRGRRGARRARGPRGGATDPRLPGRQPGT